MSFQHAMILGCVPSLFMLVSTYISLGKAVPDDVAGALQHFAAGVLLCTVGTELLPEIINAQGWAANIAALIGFFLGVAVLILLGMISPDGPEGISRHEDERKEHYNGIGNGDDVVADIFRTVHGQSPTPGQRQQLREMRFVIAGRKLRQRQTLRNSGGRLVEKRSMSLSSLPVMDEDAPLIISSIKETEKQSYTEEEEEASSSRNLLKKSDPPALTKQFPLAFVFAVAIDSSLDGLLIGIASVAGPSAGLMMSASLSVEMSFLGITLATTLSGQPSSSAAFAAWVGPVCSKLANAHCSGMFLHCMLLHV
jgi:zinc transporter ZupT